MNVATTQPMQATFLPLLAQQLPLAFDGAEGQRRADAGTEAALYGHVGQPWAMRADAWLAERGSEPFTSEHLTAALGLPSERVGKDKNNAVGAQIRAWSRRGRIRRVSYTQARRPESHGALLTVWQCTGVTALVRSA